MTDRDFVYWLQGFFEIQNPTTLTEEQTIIIKQHLDLVFTHVVKPIKTTLDADLPTIAFNNSTADLKEYEPKVGYSCGVGTITN